MSRRVGGLYPKDDEPEHHADGGVSEGTALCRSFASYGAASGYVQLYVLLRHIGALGTDH